MLHLDPHVLTHNSLCSQDVQPQVQDEFVFHRRRACAFNLTFSAEIGCIRPLSKSLALWLASSSQSSAIL